MSEGTRFVNVLDLILKSVLTVVAVAGVYLSYDQYLDRIDEARAERTLEYEKEFNSGELMQAQLALLESWNDPDSRARWSLLRQHPSLEAVADIVPHAELVGRATSGTLMEIDRIVGFFSRLRTCIDAALCDEAVARKLFSAYVDRFIRLYYPYILTYRIELASDFARDMECLFGTERPWSDDYQATYGTTPVSCD